MHPIIFFIHQYCTLARVAASLALVSFFFGVWVSFKRPKISSVTAPVVAGAWPIIGHLPQLIGSTPLFKILTAMSDKYGPIFMVGFGMHPTIVVSSWEMSKECFTTNDRFLAGRPPVAASKHLTSAFFGFSSYGPYWRELRKISTLQLLSHRRLGLLNHLAYSEIGNYIKGLHQRWMKSQNQLKQNCAAAAGSVPVDMTQVFGELTLNVVLKLVVGKPVFTKNEDYTEDNKEEEEGHKIHNTIIEFFTLAGMPVASDALPFLGWLDVDGQKKRMERVAREMNLISEKWLDEHRQKKRLQGVVSNVKVAGGHESDDESDFMDVLMTIMDKEEDDLFFGYSRDTVVKATCLNLILAAVDTTSLTLTWALSLLLTNPSCLRMAQEELHNKVGRERNVEAHDIVHLIYLQAIIKETLRLYPPGPLSVPHEAMEDCNIGGYEVTAGTRLLVNLWKMHRDPQVWSDPLKFKPERFLPQLDGGAEGEAVNLDFRGRHFEYLPFGSGRRMCPGIDFSLQSMHMMLARLLHAFDFDTTGLVMDMTEGSGLTIPKVTPLEVYLHPRLPVTLY